MPGSGTAIRRRLRTVCGLLLGRQLLRAFWTHSCEPSALLATRPDNTTCPSARARYSGFAGESPRVLGFGFHAAPARAWLGRAVLQSSAGWLCSDQRLSPELKSELASFVCLGHLAVVDLRAQPSRTIIATDASSSWQAAVSAEIFARCGCRVSAPLAAKRGVD